MSPGESLEFLFRALVTAIVILVVIATAAIIASFVGWAKVLGFWPVFAVAAASVNVGLWFGGRRGHS